MRPGWDSNHRQPDCEAGTLPLAYRSCCSTRAQIGFNGQLGCLGGCHIWAYMLSVLPLRKGGGVGKASREGKFQFC